MTEKSLSQWIRCALLLIALCGIAVCALWVPMGIGGVGIEDAMWTKAQSIALWVQFVFHWVVSLPCFWMLTVAWRMTSDMKNGCFFTSENALRIKKAAQVLFVSILVFLTGNGVFAALKWNKAFVLYCFVAVIGLILVVLLAALSHYLFRAAELQEECEGTI